MDIASALILQDLGELVGNDGAVRALESALRHGEARVVIVSGPPASGKSALARLLQDRIAAAEGARRWCVHASDADATAGALTCIGHANRCFGVMAGEPVGRARRGGGALVIEREASERAEPCVLAVAANWSPASGVWVVLTAGPGRDLSVVKRAVTARCKKPWVLTVELQHPDPVTTMIHLLDYLPLEGAADAEALGACADESGGAVLAAAMQWATRSRRAAQPDWWLDELEGKDHGDVLAWSAHEMAPALAGSVSAYAAAIRPFLHACQLDQAGPAMSRTIAREMRAIVARGVRCGAASKALAAASHRNMTLKVLRDEGADEVVDVVQRLDRGEDVDDRHRQYAALFRKFFAVSL